MKSLAATFAMILLTSAAFAAPKHEPQVICRTQVRPDSVMIAYRAGGGVLPDWFEGLDSAFIVTRWIERSVWLGDSTCDHSRPPDQVSHLAVVDTMRFWHSGGQ